MPRYVRAWAVKPAKACKIAIGLTHLSAFGSDRRYKEMKIRAWIVVLLFGTGTLWAQPVRIVASFYPMYVMALNLTEGIANVEVRCMSNERTGCLHGHHLTSSDMKALARADILIANGAGMESFLEKAAAQSPGLKILTATRGVPLEFNGNPHVWVSIRGAMAQVRSLAAQLAQADPTNAPIYRQNAQKYLAKLEALQKEMHAGLAPFAGTRIVTFHEAFPYFAKEFGLQIVTIVERHPGSEPGAGELARTVRTIREQNVRAIFVEPQSSQRSARALERETGIKVRTLDPAVSGPRDPVKARDSYLHTMRANLAALREALAP